MVPTPVSIRMIVKALPMFDRGWTSIYPTVVRVMIVMYRESKKPHLSTAINPMVPNNITLLIRTIRNIIRCFGFTVNYNVLISQM